MADRHEANRRCLAVDSINDAKAANSELSQSFEFTTERYSTFRIGGDRADRSFDGLFQVGMERLDNLATWVR